MKKTVYFTSISTRNFGWNQIKDAIDSAVEERDAFLQTNKQEIGKIDEEDIKIILLSNQQFVSAVIKLSYYPK